MDFWNLLPTLILIIVIFSLTMFVALYSTYGERKVAAFMQDRLGPNRAGPGGIFQPLADGVNMFMKEVVIPWGPDITLFWKTFSLQIANPDIGILYVFAVVSVGIYGIMIGGWASNN